MQLKALLLSSFLGAFVAEASPLFGFPFPPFGPFGSLKIISTNDDGWAEANIRAQFTSLVKAGFNASFQFAGHWNLTDWPLRQVLLSAPTENKSGTGSTTAPTTVLNITCEFDTCPIGSPGVGHNISDRASRALFILSTANILFLCSPTELGQRFPIRLSQNWDRGIGTKGSSRTT